MSPFIARSVGGVLLRRRRCGRCRTAPSCRLGSRRALRSVRRRSIRYIRTVCFETGRGSVVFIWKYSYNSSSEAAHDIFMLKNAISRNSFEGPTLCDAVVSALNEVTRKGVTLRAVGDRLERLLKVFKAWGPHYS